MVHQKFVYLTIQTLITFIFHVNASFIAVNNHPHCYSYESKRGNVFQHGTEIIHIKGQESYGHEYFDSPVMQQLDDLERRMKRNQESARELIKTVQKDVAMQKLLRSESTAAMERLHSLKYDMVRQLNQAKEHYIDDRKQLVRKMTAEIRGRDEKIERYEDERNSIKFLFRRIFILLMGKIQKRLSVFRR